MNKSQRKIESLWSRERLNTISNNFRFIVVIVLVTATAFSFSCRRAMKVEVPHASWEPNYFRQINAVAGLSGQSNLRANRLPRGDSEARIWWGFGLSPLEGVMLRRSGSQWTAIHVKADDYSEPSKAERIQLSTPRSGWDTLWTRLVNEKILSLPDASEIDCNAGGLDGLSVVVETNADNTYRTYMYNLPLASKCDEDKHILAILDIIVEEFSLHAAEVSPEEYAVLPTHALGSSDSEQDLGFLTLKQSHTSRLGRPITVSVPTSSAPLPSRAP